MQSSGKPEGPKAPNSILPADRTSEVIPTIINYVSMSAMLPLCVLFLCVVFMGYLTEDTKAKGVNSMSRIFSYSMRNIHS